MDRGIIQRNTNFLQESFRKDLERLADCGKEVRDALQSLFASAKSYDELTLEKTWAALAQQTGVTLDDALHLFAPVRFVCLVAAEESVSSEDVISSLVEAKIVPAEQQQMLLDLAKPLESFVEAAESESPPRLPGLRIESISTSCNVISEFKNEFDTSEDDPSTYAPDIRILHTYTVCRMTFRGDDSDPITIALTEKRLDNLIKWLELAKVQHLKVKNSIRLTSKETEG